MTNSSRPYSVEWYIGNRVLLITVYGELSVKQLQEMEAEAFKLIRKAPCVIHAIVDLQRLSVRPGSLQEAFKNVKRMRHKNQGTSVIVASPMHPVVKFVSSGVMTMLRLNYDICDSLEEAREKIAVLEANRSQAGTI
jgi:hypothetical protein